MIHQGSLCFSTKSAVNKNVTWIKTEMILIILSDTCM